MHLLEVWWGLINLTGPIYAFWSGFGSVFIPVVLDVAAFSAIYYWHHMCHIHKCPRIGRHSEPGTSLVVCRHHSAHPVRITYEHLLDLRRKNASL